MNNKHFCNICGCELTNKICTSCTKEKIDKDKLNEHMKKWMFNQPKISMNIEGENIIRTEIISYLKNNNICTQPDIINMDINVNGHMGEFSIDVILK